jgi:hypothetical protein
MQPGFDSGGVTRPLSAYVLTSDTDDARSVRLLNYSVGNLTFFAEPPPQETAQRVPYSNSNSDQIERT